MGFCELYWLHFLRESPYFALLSVSLCQKVGLCLYGSWEPYYMCSGFTWQDLWKALGLLKGVCEAPPWISLKSWQSSILGLIFHWSHFLVWESFVAWTSWKWELVSDPIVCFWAGLSLLTLCHPQRAEARCDSGSLPGSPFSWALSSFCPFQFPSLESIITSHGFPFLKLSVASSF